MNSPSFYSVAIVSLFLLLPSPGSRAADTGIFTLGHVDGKYPRHRATTEDGPTIITTGHYTEVNPATATPGSLEGQGEADFGEHKVRIYTEGASAQRATCEAVANDTWTINHPGREGTQGTVQLAFDLQGTVEVLGLLGSPVMDDDSFASVSLQVLLGGGSVRQMNESLETGPVSFRGEEGSPTVTDPFTFTYGTPFQVTIRLMAIADPDNRFLRAEFNPYFEHYGGGTVSEVTVDFLNGGHGKLTTIAIPGSDATTQIVTESLTDHQSLLATEIPPPPPQLSVVRLPGGTVRASWPLPATGWVLDRSPTLGQDPTPWTEVPGGEIQDDGTERYHLIANPVGEQYFRLRLP